jgi:hypothetical protein
LTIQRIWAMPNKLTFTIKPIKDLLTNEITNGLWLDPFANDGTFKKLFGKYIEVIDNDLNPNYQTQYHLDAIDFLKEFKDNSIDGVVYDPPYSTRQVSECYKGVGRNVTSEDTRMTFWSNAKNEIARILKPNGKVICFGWNSMGVGASRGFKMETVLLVPHGGSKNDTICTVERKCE